MNSHMKNRWKKKLNGLKLNRKFTLIIILLVIVPFSLLAGVLFYNMKENVIRENVTYMQYTMERCRDNIQENIDSVNTTTQFFLSDDSLIDALNSAADGEKMTTKELLEFYHSNIASLERLVNNNTLLYGVRVYAVNDHVQEMMPVLYSHSRMEKMDWAKKPDFTGWNYNYQDKLFENWNKKKIASLITPVKNHKGSLVGVIEAAVTMDALFPSLYEDIENEWSCFISDEGNLYFGDNKQENSEEFVRLELEEGLEEEVEEDEIHTDYKKRGGEHYIVSYMYIREMGVTLLSVQNISDNLRRVYQLRNIFLVVMLVILIGLTFLINRIVKHLLKHFYEILTAIRTIQRGDLSVRIEHTENDEMGELGVQINKMLVRIERLIKESIDRELLVKNSEIRALQNQINAHFIYNVLESIKMMAEIDEEYAISDAILSLGKLLRYSMHWGTGNVLVEEEIEYIRNYLALMNLRFDYEIHLSLRMPELILRQEIPKMSLQPIIENAICHSIEQLAEDASIYMDGTIAEGDCIIEITDQGRGMSAEEVAQLRKKIAGEIESSGGSGHGIGLKNVQDRLRITFGKAYGIGIESKLGYYTKITLRIPMNKNA